MAWTSFWMGVGHCWKERLLLFSAMCTDLFKPQTHDVHAVFAFGSANWSWTMQTLEKIKGWETKTMLRLFRFKRHKEETWVDYHARTCNMARKISIQMGLPFLSRVRAHGKTRE